MPRNPFLSLWLSAAHRAGQPARHAMMAAARRQQAQAAQAGLRAVQDAWTQALRGKPPRQER